MMGGGSAMIESMPEAVRAARESARLKAARRARLRVHTHDEGTGGGVFEVLRLWDGGLALDARHLPRLRGLVDIHDGPRHILQCLVVASGVEGDELVCEFKRSTRVSDRAPLDFWKDEDAPAGYLARP